MLLNPEDGSSGCNMMSSAPEDQGAFICCVCGDTIDHDSFCGAAAGGRCCTACTKTWIITQIMNGDSLRLRCPCGKLENLRYVDIRKLFGTSAEEKNTAPVCPNQDLALELYKAALYRHNQNESIRDYNNTITTRDILLLPFCTSRQDVECPECSTVTKIPIGVKSYECHHRDCPGRGNSGTPAKICVIHQTRYVRRRHNKLDQEGQQTKMMIVNLDYNVPPRGVSLTYRNNKKLLHQVEGQNNNVDLRSPRVCLKCEEEKDTKDKNAEHDVKNAILQEIRTEFVDKCPNCQNVLGEPEDIVHNCMCLRCSHCPMSVCGFCYLYSNKWNETHQHISTSCPKNPRPNNYYAESELVWRQLMKDRRISILDNILDRHRRAASLSPDQLEDIRQEALGYL